MATKQPLVSIIMPVFNAQNFVDQAIESILGQTYSNFEFIIIDDASTDNSWSIIKTYAKKDNRIKIFRNKINMGVSFTANKAIKIASGKFLVRMDADDISFSNRIETQLNFLKQNPKIVTVGSQCIVIDDQNKNIGNKTFPLNPSELKDMIFWAIPIQQPSMMVNLQKLPQNFQWYSNNFSSAEEVDLMFKFLKFGQIANLPNFLLFYRHLNNSLSHKNPKLTFNLTLKSRIKAISFGFRPSARAIILNLVQIIAINLLPTSTVFDLWYRFRGINQNQPTYSNLLTNIP